MSIKIFQKRSLWIDRCTCTAANPLVYFMVANSETIHLVSRGRKNGVELNVVLVSSYRCVAARHWKYSAGFLNACNEIVFVLAQSGFHLMPFAFCNDSGRSALQFPLVVRVKFETFETPTLSMHFCMKRSSPQGPNFQSGSWPFQSREDLQDSRLERKVLNASEDTTSRCPKKPYITFLQFSM